MASKNILAEELNGQDLGREIVFDWQFPSAKVDAKITGKLREVNHNGRYVIVEVTGKDAPGGDKKQFVLKPGFHIVVRLGE